MKRFCPAALGLVLALASSSSLALDVDRETVKIRAVEPPLVNVAEIDLGTVRVDLAFGRASIGEPTIRTAKTWCVPHGSENRIRDAIELPTYYYEIPYRVADGVIVVRDASGAAIHSASLEALESYERFGYDQCRYSNKQNLDEDYPRQRSAVESLIQAGVREYFDRMAKRELDDALFFNVLTERVPLYRFKDKRHDYSDLDRAREVARRGYENGLAGHADLESAIEIWEAALAESDLNDKQARINRKVTIKLYESIGIAQLTLGDPAAAVDRMEKAKRYATVTISRSDGAGSQDLLDRARERKQRDRRNPGLPTDPAELDALIELVESFRGTIPIHVRSSSELDGLMAEHVSRSSGDMIAAYQAEREEHEAAVESGAENPYERMVGRTPTQGYYLFLMPFSGKLDSFPHRVCELTHLNQLRAPNHGFDSVPDTIGLLEALKFLDLSGNNIARLPDSIGKLRNLKTLKLKGNPLAEGEVERLKTLLPGCKIKG